MLSHLPLPNALHREWALKALDAGKHVLCEKPLVLSSSEVDELAQAAASADRVVMEAFMYRLHPQYEQSTWKPLLAELVPVRLAHVRFSSPSTVRVTFVRMLSWAVAPSGISEAIVSMC